MPERACCPPTSLPPLLPTPPPPTPSMLKQIVSKRHREKNHVASPRISAVANRRRPFARKDPQFPQFCHSLLMHCICSTVSQSRHYMNSMKLVIRLHIISWKKTPNDAVTPQRQSQVTPKVKANAVARLLSSLVWIDQYNECNGMTSFMEFMLCI